ncbi:hypothetical protein ALC57_13230 [Trachymyrmex cornetzi]|uniref:Uncharacterized protein n=1 Tax=Trachymyrmex cornetzi TaxID=471704 RepID=A0A151J038_9HYME|nr:hypothetical protein ALC57_13230 [Trachymyrmex cornetzi]
MRQNKNPRKGDGENTSVSVDVSPRSAGRSQSTTARPLDNATPESAKRSRRRRNTIYISQEKLNTTYYVNIP